MQLLQLFLTRLVLEVVDGDPSFATACLSPIARARGRALAVGDGRRGQVVEAEAAAKLGVEKCQQIGMSHSSDSSDFNSPFVLCSIHAACMVKSVGQKRDQSIKIIGMRKRFFFQERKIITVLNCRV